MCVHVSDAVTLEENFILHLMHHPQRRPKKRRMERSKCKVASGFSIQLLLYLLYIACGIAVIALQTPSEVAGGPRLICLVNIKIYSG